jgi:hypothetical protein
MTTITAHQLHLLHHTLGLTPERREPFRNYFMAGPGHHDQADLLALEAAGLMRQGRTPSFCDDGDMLFLCTDAGKTYAIEHLPLPPKKSRYEEYLDAEYGHSFAEWLGIEVPKLESGDYWHKTRGLVRYTSSRATGEWAATKKAAKASYKAALSAGRAMQKGCTQ